LTGHRPDGPVEAFGLHHVANRTEQARDGVEVEPEVQFGHVGDLEGNPRQCLPSDGHHGRLDVRTRTVEVPTESGQVTACTAGDVKETPGPRVELPDDRGDLLGLRLVIDVGVEGVIPASSPIEHRRIVAGSPGSSHHISLSR